VLVAELAVELLEGSNLASLDVGDSSSNRLQSFLPVLFRGQREKNAGAVRLLGEGT
jgi:hypothetical protein